LLTFLKLGVFPTSPVPKIELFGRNRRPRLERVGQGKEESAD
jgi:hypothetical protein